MDHTNGHEQSTLSAALAGAIGGAAGAMAMRAMTFVAQKAGLVDEPVPLKIERELEQRAGFAERTGPGEEKALAAVEHLGIGAGFGALYGVLDQALDLPDMPAGPLYGIGVYALNFGGFGPAFGLVPPPTQEEPPSVVRKVMAHGLYGMVTAAVTRRAKEMMAG